MRTLRLGVLTLYLKNKKTFEEREFFRLLTGAGKSLGVEVYVFTPQNVDERARKIHAHRYDLVRKRWRREWIAYPDLFYDRSRYHVRKRFIPASAFRKRHPELIFISSQLTNKWKLYAALSQNPAIRGFLPETALYLSFRDLAGHLRRHPIVYLKPVTGTGGRGILRIRRLSAGVYAVSGRRRDRSVIPERKTGERGLRALVEAFKPKGKYLIQQGIDLRLNNGSVHDYRLLIQKNGEGRWEVTGCVGRLGPSGSVTSNLHGGGKAVPMKKLLGLWFRDETRAAKAAEDAEAFAHRLAEALEQTYGPLCELALDLAVDRSGHIWLLEVNTKPAREVFRRIGDKSAYLKAIRRPLEYARWLYEHRR